jgi:hypothetical protein
VTVKSATFSSTLWLNYLGKIEEKTSKDFIDSGLIIALQESLWKESLPIQVLYL